MNRPDIVNNDKSSPFYSVSCAFLKNQTPATTIDQVMQNFNFYSVSLDTDIHLSLIHADKFSNNMPKISQK